MTTTKKAPPKPTPVAQAEKQASIPRPVTQSALAPDVKFGNMLIAERDAATVELQSLQSQLVIREGQYEREKQRLEYEFEADFSSLTEQIDQYMRIVSAADRSIADMESMTVKPDNVVQMKEA